MSSTDEIVRSHNIFIQSIFSDPSDFNYNFNINLPEGQIMVDDPGTQVIRLTLISFSVPYSWPQVNAFNNTMTINDIYNNKSVTILLPIGIYSYPQLCAAVNSQWGSTIISFDINQLKFIFSSKTILKLTFVNQSYNTYGFSSTDQGITGMTITSTKCLSEKQLQNIYVTIDDILQSGPSSNFDNISITNGMFRQSNILCIIPIETEPWGTLYYNRAENAKMYSIDLNILRLSRFTICLKDGAGNYLYDIPNYEMVIRAEIVNKVNTETQTIVSNLQMINETLSQIKLMKYLNNSSQYRKPEIPQVKIIKN